MGCVLKVGFVGRSRLGACATCGFAFPLMPVNVCCSHSRRGERWRTVGAGVIRVAMGVGVWWVHRAVALVGWCVVGMLIRLSMKRLAVGEGRRSLACA